MKCLKRLGTHLKKKNKSYNDPKMEKKNYIDQKYI